jgi:hypothetical protein
LEAFARPYNGYGLSMPSLSKTARNLAVADVALAFARDRIAARLPGVEPRKRRPGAKTLLIGGGVAAAAAALLFKREKVVGLLPGRTDEPAPPTTPSYTPPPVSNYDAPGPVANTSTPVPVPPAFEAPTIDEAAEEAAAAAEAANIGGTVSDYAGTEYGEVASPEEVPLAEAGQGESEGQEQTELELRDAAESRDEGLSPEQAQIDEAIDQAANPLASEQVEPVKPADDSEWRTWSGRTVDP